MRQTFRVLVVTLMMTVGLVAGAATAFAAPTADSYQTGDVTCNIYKNAARATTDAWIYTIPPQMTSNGGNMQVGWRPILQYHTSSGWVNYKIGVWLYGHTNTSGSIDFATSWPSYDLGFTLRPGELGYYWRTTNRMNWYWNGQVVATALARSDIHTQFFHYADGSDVYGNSGDYCWVPR